jgi:hypothetical protein
MIVPSAGQKSFGSLGSKPILVEPAEEHLTSDAGLLPIRQFDEQIGLTAEFASDDRRGSEVPTPRQVAKHAVSACPRRGFLSPFCTLPIPTYSSCPPILLRKYASRGNWVALARQNASNSAKWAICLGKTNVMRKF